MKRHEPDGVTGFSGFGWRQYEDEVRRFVEIMLEDGATSYLEVGCLYGDTLHYVGMRLPEGSKIVAVDLPGSAGRRFKETDKYLHKAADDLRANGRDVTVIIGDSHERRIIRKAKELGPYDVVFIDGDHSIEGVRQDWEAYGPLGRIIGFHDICRQSEKYQDGVKALYDGLAETHRHETITIGQVRRGIGVIWRN